MLDNFLYNNTPIGYYTYRSYIFLIYLPKITDATSVDDSIPFRGFITQPVYTIYGLGIDYISGFSDGTLPICSIKLICAELN